MAESGQLELTSGTQEQVLENGYYGSATLPYTRLLSKRCPRPPFPFVSPDYFDADSNWRRIITVDTTALALTVSPAEGSASWYSQKPVDSDWVQQKLSQMLVPLSLPETAIDSFASDVFAAFSQPASLIHIASETLWEALVKGIIRQVITALQAKKVLDRFVTRYGEKIECNGMLYYAFPSIQTILHTPLDELYACGLGFKAKTIASLAHTLSEQKELEHTLLALPAEEALVRLKAIKGIGDWTARVAYCDLTADWTLHPCDMAVRYWAKACFPQIKWQTSEADFQQQFLALFARHSGMIIALLLIYGPISSHTLFSRVCS